MITYMVVFLISLVVYSLYFMWTTEEELEFSHVLFFTLMASIWPLTLPLFCISAGSVALFDKIRWRG